MKKPDFFIVGAPKCGTTAMDEYLKQHPDIFIPRQKELHFFGSDLNFSFPRISKEKYLACFSKAWDEKRLGESSVWYLYSKKAAQEIKSFCPSAVIIIMLRNPVDMLYSQHSQFLYNGNENIGDFKQAMEAEDDRKQGRYIPRRAHFVEGLFYTETVKFTDQVKRYFNIFGRQNVHVIIFDDFKTDTAAAYQDTLDFLGVNPLFRPHFKVVNPNKLVRSRILRNFLINPPKAVRWVQESLIPWPVGIMRKLRSLNTKYAPRPPLELKFRRRLQEQFLPEIEALSNLIGRDLTCWTED